MNRGGVASWLLVILMVAVASYGGPSQVCAAPPPPFHVAQDLPGLVQAASLIMVGKVVDVKSGRIAGKGDARLEFKDVQVSVERWLKGDGPATIIVEQVSQERRVVLSPEVGPPYSPDERYLLFLLPGEGGRYVTFGRGRFYLEGGKVPVLDMDETKFIEEIQALARGQK